MNGKGAFILKGPQDWEILQHQNHQATVTLSGVWILNELGGLQLREPPCVMVRLIKEEDNLPIIYWTKADTLRDSDGVSGEWSCTMQFPAGGLYRIETGLYTDFGPDKRWFERGDARFHIGVGNVFVIAGQSNAAGCGRDSAWDPPELGVHALRNCGTWDLAAHPLNDSTGAAHVPNAEDGITGTSPYLSFGREFRRLSGYPVGLCMTALGGSPIADWVKSIHGNLYHNMMERIKLLGGNIAGILWYQGCRDAESRELAEQYGENFKTMVQDVRDELLDKVPFFTFQLNAKINSPNKVPWSIVKEAQRSAAHSIEHVYILPTSDCTTSDLIHNCSSGNISLGKRLALQCASVICNGVRWEAPDIRAAIYKDGFLTLSFANSMENFQTFNLTPDECFEVEDDNGAIQITHWEYDIGQIVLTLQREIRSNLYVSFGTGPQPLKPPICDGATYLPILSFYKFPVMVCID